MYRSLRHSSAFLIGFFTFITGINAQFTKGTRMVGASVASMVFNSGSSDQTVAMVGSTTANVTSYAFSLTPSLGWFVSDNTAVGISLSLNPSSEKISFEESGSTFQRDKKNDFSIGLGGFARNYFKTSGSLLPFGQLGLDAGFNTRKTEGFFYGGTSPDVYKTSYDGKSSGGFFTNIGLTGGITKMLGQNAGLDIYLGYNFSYSKNTMTTTTLRDELIDGTIDETGKNEITSKVTNHRFIFGIGFQIFLDKRK